PTEKIDTIAGSKAYGSVTATNGLAWSITTDPTTKDNDIIVSPTEGIGDADLTFTAISDNDGAERTSKFIVTVDGAKPERTDTITATQEPKNRPVIVENF
ncbi:MAG: hypothetical protein LUD46_06705, partial [Parabacteroides sp.]|nr:hypothetical protein [Parabacteroides sp.]